jgi:hypothetical protein
LNKAVRARARGLPRGQGVNLVYGVGRGLGTPRAALLKGVQFTVATEEHVL